MRTPAHRSRLRQFPLTFVLLTMASSVAAQSSDPALEHARKLLESTPLIDGHNDLAWEIRESKDAPRDVAAYDIRRTAPKQTDLPRLKEGKVAAQFWSIYIPGEIKDSGYARVQLEQFDIARRMIARYPDRLALALTADDIVRDFKRGRIASLLGMEGGHAIENSLGALRSYYDLGARYMTLTHNVTLDWADAALDTARHDGLTEFGKEVVREMNRLGMLVDLSHVAPSVMSDALNVSEAPVIFSHSAARALTEHPRNVPDSILARLPKNGGVVMVTFVPGFISPKVNAWNKLQTAEQDRLKALHPDDPAAVKAGVDAWTAANPAPNATLSEVADHIDHIRKVAGIDHIGLGSDFDGITQKVRDLDDVSKYPNLIAELLRRGYSDGDIKKITGQNVLRVFREVEKVSKRLQSERGPSVATFVHGE